MTREEVGSLVRSVVADTFGVDATTVDDATAPQDIAAWDSLQYTVVLIRLQTQLGVRLPAETLVAARNVGELADVIAAAVAA